MKMERFYRNETWMLNLSALSLLCLLIELGLWAYAGSPLPQTRNAGDTEKLVIWVIWIAIVAVPFVTALLWLVRLRASGR